jgi:hypothetical protein
MDTIFYVTRQRNGWSVERGRIVQSGHADRDTAISQALDAAATEEAHGLSACVRIQETDGGWRECRSFSPRRN